MQSKLPEREIAICNRFRQIRELLHLTHAQVADLLQITVHVVAAYEYARAPIRWPIGLAFCRVYDVNQLYLATGKGPMFYYVPIAPEYRHVIPKRLLFSEAFDLFLTPHVQKHLERLAKMTDTTIDKIDPWLAHEHHPYGVGEISAAQLHFMLTRDLRGLIDVLPQHTYHEFFAAMLKTMRRFRKKHESEISAQASRPKSRTKNPQNRG